MLVDPIIRGTEHDLREIFPSLRGKTAHPSESRRTARAIENFNAHHHVNVRLDSGHFVQYHPDEIEPEDWQRATGETAATGDDRTDKLQRVLAAGGSP